MKQLACVLICCAAAFSQVAEKANEGYRTKEGREGVAKALGSATRDETQKPRDIIEAMAIKPGGTVADVGTGIGFMVPYLSHAVGDKGTVVAEDIQTDFLDQAKLKVQVLGREP